MVPGGHLPRVPHRAIAAFRGRRLRRQDALAGARARRPHRALAASPGRLTGLAALGRASPTRGGHGAPVVVVLVRRSRPASLCRPLPASRLLVAQPLTTPGGGRFRLRRGSPVQLQRKPQAWVVVRGHHGHEGSGQVVGHQAAQPPATSGQGQKILSRGRVPRCVSTLRAQDDQALRAGGPSDAGQANKVTRGERHDTRPRTSNITNTTGRPQPNSTRQPRRKSRPRAAAPRAARRDEHKSERQRATARNGRPRPPPRQHSSRPRPTPVEQ